MRYRKIQFSKRGCLEFCQKRQYFDKINRNEQLTSIVSVQLAGGIEFAEVI